MKKIPAVLLAAVLLLLCLFSSASAVTVESAGELTSGEFRYRYRSDGTAVITGYDGKSEELIIPASLGEVPVTAIGSEAFKSNNALLYVTLPTAVEEIGDYAFFYCRNLSMINLPDSVRTVGRNPFAACENLSVIEISDHHPYLSLQDGVLYSLPDQRLIAYSMLRPKGPYDVAEGTKIIGASAFYICKTLTGLTLPESVTSIGKQAFFQCSQMKSINLPEGVYA